MEEELPLYDPPESDDGLGLEDILEHFEEIDILSPPLFACRGAIVNALLRPSIEEWFGEDRKPKIITGKKRGEGGYSEVYDATLWEGEKQWQTPLVVKRTKLGHLAEDERELAIQLALRECASLAILGGIEGVAEIMALYFKPSGQEIQTVQTRVPGRPLLSEKEKVPLLGELSNLEIYQVGLRLMEILERVHAKGLIHGDLKPEQVLVDEHLETHLIDFQMAHWEDRLPHFIEPGTMIGTARYMSPECLQGNWSGGRFQFDLWALGVSLFQFFSETQSNPFAFVSMEGLQRILVDYHRGDAFLPDFDEITHKPTRKIIQRLMAPKIQDRYPTIKEVIKDFRRIVL